MNYPETRVVVFVKEDQFPINETTQDNNPFGVEDRVTIIKCECNTTIVFHCIKE